MKTLRKLEMEGNLLVLIKGIYEKPIATITANGEEGMFSTRFRKKARNQCNKAVLLCLLGCLCLCPAFTLFLLLLPFLLISSFF